MNIDEAIEIATSTAITLTKLEMAEIAEMLAKEVERLQTNIERLESEIKQANKEIDRLEKTVHKYKTGGLRR